MQVKPIALLTTDEAIDLAHAAAERGECIEDANPFPDGSARGHEFVTAFALRCSELRISIAA